MQFRSFAALATVASAITATLDWDDCGDADTHVVITDLSPLALPVPGKTTVTAAGILDEDQEGGDFKFKATIAGVPVTSGGGDLCKGADINLPLGAGSISFQPIPCPSPAGDVSVKLDISLAASLPVQDMNSLIKIDVTATSTSGDKLFCMKINVDSPLEQSGCSGTDDFPSAPACYGNNVMGKEDVVLKIEDFSAGAGHFSFKGTGGAELSCETAFTKDSSNKITFDNCDVSGYATVKGAQYCSDTDELKATFNPLGVPIPVSATFPRVTCPADDSFAEQSTCSGTDDFPSTPACYGSNVMGKEDVILKIEDFSAGAGHFSFKGTGGAELSCETAFTKDSSNKIAFDNCDVSGYATVKGAQYCSDTDELKATFNPLGVPIPVSATFPKVACPAAVEV